MKKWLYLLALASAMSPLPAAADRFGSFDELTIIDSSTKSLPGWELTSIGTEECYVKEYTPSGNLIALSISCLGTGGGIA